MWRKDGIVIRELKGMVSRGGYFYMPYYDVCCILYFQSRNVQIMRSTAHALSTALYEQYCIHYTCQLLIMMRLKKFKLENTLHTLL